MFYLVYRITHQKSNHFYIGRHTTDNINDSYYGSGSHPLLKDRNNLTKEILFSYNSPEQMIQKEIELIIENINDPLCMNMIIGDPTYGGVINHSQKSKDRIKDGMIRHINQDPNSFKEKVSMAGKCLKGRKQSKEHIEKLSKARKGVVKSEEFKKKVSSTLSGRLLRPRKTLCKKWKITDIIENVEYITSDRVKFCEQIGIKYSCFNVGTRNNNIYKKRWLCEKIN